VCVGGRGGAGYEEMKRSESAVCAGDEKVKLFETEHDGTQWVKLLFVRLTSHIFERFLLRPD
jgi:hypothetical protein